MGDEKWINQPYTEPVPNTKILPIEHLPAWRASQREAGKKIVATNGCFDLLHVGHVRYLIGAKELGDILIIGVNDDASVRELKGAERPLNTAEERAEVLAALEAVDCVTIFSGKRATQFLEAVAADVYVKGGDYQSIAQLDQEEVETVQHHGGKIELLPLVPGRSTTNVLAKWKKTQ